MKFLNPAQSTSDHVPNRTPVMPTWEHRAATIMVIGQGILSSAILGLSWQKLPPKIPFWYSRPWGDERLAHPLFAILMPLTAFVCYALNRKLSITIGADHPLFSRTLSLVSFLVSWYSCVIVIRVITLIV